jgi:uncharacterized membrane protein
MFAVIERLFRHAVYDLRGGFLVRPLVIAFVLGGLGIVLPIVEEHVPVVHAWASSLPVLAPHDPTAAAGILASIIGAMMTVVSIVLSVLLVALTLASMQFSPRILTAFVEDRTSQRTIGIFLGTFGYCLFVYPTVRQAPPVTPAAAVLGSMLLAIACTVALVIFVHHIARSINVNFITERIATETERVIDEVMPDPLPEARGSDDHPLPAFDEGPPIRATRSGYIRYIDMDRLAEVASSSGLAIRVERRVGQYVVEGAPLVRLSRKKELDAPSVAAVLGAIDLGLTRTMEQDIEFGVLQLVDIALKAISPAVNDPSTAINCIDHLSRVLVRVASRDPARSVVFDPPGVVRVVAPPLALDRLLDLAFDQIAQYAKTDVAVSLRIQRALGDLAQSTTDGEVLSIVHEHAERAAEACLPTLPERGASAVRARLGAVLGRRGGG